MDDGVSFLVLPEELRAPDATQTHKQDIRHGRADGTL